jgi:ElaB/YqjD/DUF883 family membrane-anchored ribosome-binding protein
MSHATEKFSSNTMSEGARCETDELKQKASEVKQNVADLGATAKKAAQEQVQNLKQTAGQYMEQGREQYESLKSSASDYVEQGRHRAMEMERTLESQIRSQPMRSVLIAAGVGMVAGILLCRR